MKTTADILVLLISMVALLSCNQRNSANGTNRDWDSDKKLVAQNDSVALYIQIVDSAKDEFDIQEVALWIKNKTTKKETKLYQTIRPDWHCWYMADGDRFYPVPIDSILVTSRVKIYNYDPLQLIVEGCPDMRNEFSYLIDVDKRKAWYVPANQGYIGSTSEEGYMIFQSYRYVSDPDIAGRYTFLQIFDETGNLVDSLDLEHVRLKEYRNAVQTN